MNRIDITTRDIPDAPEAEGVLFVNGKRWHLPRGASVELEPLYASDPGPVGLLLKHSAPSIFAISVRVILPVDPSRTYMTSQSTGLPTPPCPECACGKHRNCDGRTWAPEVDDYAPCPCAAAEHLPEGARNAQG